MLELDYYQFHRKEKKLRNKVKSKPTEESLVTFENQQTVILNFIICYCVIVAGFFFKFQFNKPTC